MNEKNRKAVNTSSWTFLVLNRDLRVEASVKTRLVLLNEKNRKAVNTSSWTFLVLNRDLRVEASALNWKIRKR
ncbi:MAG: hypothetical protein R2766_09490 [Saprospiraceae bacterium]